MKYALAVYFTFIAALSQIQSLGGLPQEGLSEPAASEVWIVGTESNYPPYSFLDENGEPAGFNVDLAKAIGEATGIKVVIKYGAWDEVRSALIGGEIQAIAGMYYSRERDAQYEFTAPYALVHHAIFARSDSPAVNSLGEMRGQRIAVMRGDIIHEHLVAEGISEELVLVENQAEGLQLLSSGAVDYALIARLPGLYWKRELNLPDIGVTGPLVNPEKYCFSVREEESERVFRLGEGLAIVKETGEYQEIYERWLGALEPRGVPIKTMIKYTLIVLGPLSFLLVGWVGWTWALKRQVRRRTEELERESFERRKVEAELQKIQSLRSLGTLAGGIAHDFNNILMGIYGNITIAKEELDPEHPSSEWLATAEQSLTQATRLTKQLLTFSLGGEPVREEVALLPLINEVISFDLSGKRVAVQTTIAEGLWPADVDRGQIQQVFSNLVINAAQAMPDGGDLSISAENCSVADGKIPGVFAGDYLKVDVRDSGAGISPENLERVFDPYFTTKKAGSGLGLATAYSIIIRHGGSIAVASKLGKGTTFTFYLPAASASSVCPEPLPKSVAASSNSSARVLVMDDDQPVRMLVTRILTRNGFAVEAVTDGSEAIQAYAAAFGTANPFDLVIMDLTVPGGVGGTEAVAEILKIDPDAKCIVSSGYANDPVMAKFADYGFKGFAAKPFSSQKLLETLNAVL